ncbi:structure-specific endonuclease subunit slx1 [Schistocerca americana]|uniref:structure-specific endonuclease subunit slx1 n=1 Tax=Schistocerca americana TaxID=7009 RepID=UPI001F4F1F18|nr:structure-specific endonuclease subunit slx1 [Schistocerca americana]
MSCDDVVEQFYGVYLLYCMNPKYKGRTYIGYTVDPNRRIKQHNKGKQAGGAWRTNNHGPWEMVLIVHGFPNDISALRFEWAWQHPDRSRRLRHVSSKSRTEKMYDYCLRVLSEMLRVGPWKRLPLTVRWLNQDYCRDLKAVPPLHMPMSYGPVVSAKVVSADKASDPESTLPLCLFCHDAVSDASSLSCVTPGCPLIAHIICLAQHFSQPGQLLPVEGNCPSCKSSMLWGDLVRKKKGCYSNLTAAPDPISIIDSP